MPVWSGTPVPITRMLGQVDQDDPTNLPVGCAAVCRNTDFTRDSTGGALSPATRAGNCMIAQGARAPGTGLWDFQYQPESSTDPFFQMLTRFTQSGQFEYEKPSGTGRLIPIPTGMFTPPTLSHRVDTQAGNILWSAYSNLKTPTSGLSGFNPKTLKIDPLGMKPYGFRWQPSLPTIYAGEVCTPSNQSSGPQGNGHTYQAQNTGSLGAKEPAWPVNEGGEVAEVVPAGQVPVVWKELTMAIANRLPEPGAPLLALAAGGNFPANQTVSIFLTFLNGMGETVAGATAFITTTAANQAVSVTIPGLANLAGWLTQLLPPYSITGVNIYEADVISSDPAPPQAQFELVGTFALGTTQLVLTTAAGVSVPTINSARITPGQYPAPITEAVIARSSAGSVVNPPGAPGLVLVPDGGVFPANQTVYVLLTLTNSAGETTAGAIASVTTTAANQGVRVSLAAQYGATVTGINIYEADVPQNTTPPLAATFDLQGSYLPGATPVISTTASGANPPVNNTATLPVGAFPAGRDVWVRLSYSNSSGETPLGPSNSIVNTLADDAVLVTLSAVPNYPQIDIINIYEADVATGATEPPISAYARVGAYPVTAVTFITETATGQPPVTVNGTGPGGNVAADTSDGGINSTQGFRYAVPAWINRNETVSGFTQAAVSSYIVDEDGWGIAVFNVPRGPANIVGRVINWSVADSTQEGPFWWIGLVDLQVPSQNIVYPNSYQSDGIEIIPTVFLDNLTTTGTFNFSDEYLETSNNTTDRLRVTLPPTATRVDYLLSIDRLALAGVPGYQTGLWISLPLSDYESYYGDTSPVPISTDSGEVCWGCVEFRNQIYAIRERSGLVITPGPGDPSTWDVKQRWDDVGACGPRAFDSCGQFLIFVHRSGVYKYDGTGAPDLMSKEIPRMWGSINWNAQQVISVAIDTDTHTVRIQAPVGQSTTPNMEFCLSYLEGWLNPIHFSTFQQREVSQEAARRWSFNDVSSYVCKRIYRTVANPPPILLGPDGTSQSTTDQDISQLAYTTTDPSGLINARTPGRFDDNGAGIDWKYQTVSAKSMQKPSKPEGVVTSIVGFGQINVGFLAGRKRITDFNVAREILWCLLMDLIPQGSVDYTRKPQRSLGEYWSVVYTNGAVPGNWASVKGCIPYIIPVKASRGSLDIGR